MVQGERIPEPCLYEEDADRAYKWAMDAWWNERESLTNICNIIGVPRWKVNKWVLGEGGWKEKKIKATKHQIAKQVESEKDRIDHLMKKIFGLLDRSVERLSDEMHVLSISEFNTFAGAAEKLFKIRQLMLGNPTDIFAEQGAAEVTWDKVIRRLKTVDILDFEAAAETAEKKALDGPEH